LVSFCTQAGIDSPILHPGFFDDDLFLTALRRSGLKVWMNLPVFFDEGYLNDNPDAYSITSFGNRAAYSWLHMVCPSQDKYIDLKLRQFHNLIKKIHPDYISYDFIRFYVFWEQVELDNPADTIEHGCYCPECQRRYLKFSGERLSLTNRIVERSQRELLGEWKKTVITEITRKLNDMVNEAAQGTPIYIKTIPWKTADLDHGIAWISGQDIERLGSISDGIIPMALTQIDDASEATLARIVQRPLAEGDPIVLPDLPIVGGRDA